ncbi:TonB-dependent receptor [Piscinibacter sakaiensis]|uniref:TonB-dependent receptor n=1 Tax=Piscinibacter sakaiensis TaxID=1547922 RepID=A0A0K8P1G4_PISS1|nr:TonB-dependent receptor [Piscinibacter sakaiensis]GAP36471.1 TonB-dependent receptor [Piscinibacter sakaiensis]
MFRTRPISKAAWLLCAGGTALSAAAQQPAASSSAATLDRVEITGSLIRRIEGESALPVVTLKIDDLAKAGVTNAEQAVKFITQQQGGTVTSGSVSGTNGAASYADLRALGAQRTLVLLNGKRVVANPFSSVAVDLNTLPLSAIERIETLPDGASATYGTDAIAGVINFITRREYQGAEISVQTQAPAGKGGDITTGNLLFGFGDLAGKGWNVYAGVNLRQQKPMLGTDRDFSRTSYVPEQGFNGLSPTTFPANYSQVVNGVTTVANTNPTLPTCAPPTSLFAPQPVVGLGTNRCGADTQAFTRTVPEQDQASIFLRGALALSPNHTASLEYFLSRNIVETQIAPSPESGLTMPITSPYYPGNGITPVTAATLDRTQPISIAWRTTVLGPRAGKQENDTQRLVAGLDGTLGDWDYQASALWSNAKVENYFLNGYPQTVALRNGVSGANGAPFLNPFGEQSAAGLAYLRQNQVLGKVQDGEGTLTSLAASASRAIGRLPGGPISLALGAEFRTEEMVYNTDVPKVSQAASSGLAGSGAVRKGDRDVSAVAAELSLPIVKGLEMGVSVRADKYSDFGDTVNPKLSLRWLPSPMVLLRGSVNTGFTAPTLTQLYAPNATTFTATRYNDPVLCPGGTPAAGAVPSRDCGIQFQRLTGGNAGLQAEESKSWTVGFVLQPAQNFSFGLDYWRYHVKNSISTIGEQSVFADPTKYASLFVRCSQAPADRRAVIGACNVPGGDPLAYIIDTNANLGDVKTEGVDLQANWASGSTAYGRFTASLRGSYVSKFEFQTEPGGRWFNPVGNYNAQWAGPVIRYQQLLTVGWEQGSWSGLLSNRFLKGYRDQNSVPAPFNTNTVGDYSIFDVSVTWRGIKNLTLQAGVLNLLDKDPPFTNQLSRFQARGYDDRFHNPLGRTYQVSAKYTF